MSHRTPMNRQRPLSFRSRSEASARARSGVGSRPPWRCPPTEWIS
jgi:hypothetical protein